MARKYRLPAAGTKKKQFTDPWGQVIGDLQAQRAKAGIAGPAVNRSAAQKFIHKHGTKLQQDVFDYFASNVEDDGEFIRMLTEAL